MPIKVTIIGAGSLIFSRRLMHDILAVPELRNTTFGLTDISKRNLDMAARLVRRDLKANKLRAKVISTQNRRKALEGANYVINSARIGGLAGLEMDVEIPLKYGVDQCVGDTLSAGGIMYGQRNFPALMEFCDDIKAVSKPGALMLNYANPNAMNTWAVSKYGGVPVVGLCHGVAGSHYQIAQAIEVVINKGRRKGSKAYREVSPKEVDVIAAGINHQTWFIKVEYRGKDWTGRLIEGFEKHPWYRKSEKLRIDMLRRFGYWSTESNGHLSEYVPWYRKDEKKMMKWIDMRSWGGGETAGYLRACMQGRNWFRTDFPNLMKAEPPVIGPENRSSEHGSWIIEALETGRVYRGHFNVVNGATIPNLPADAIVEVPGYVDRHGINVPRVGELPLGCAAVCNASISVQRLSVEAAAAGDLTLLRQAMMMDPLVGAVLEPPEIGQMTDEMLVANAEWLPQYAADIPKAKKRLKGAKMLYRRGYKGARKQMKTVAEMRKKREVWE